MDLNTALTFWDLDHSSEHVLYQWVFEGWSSSRYLPEVGNSKVLSIRFYFTSAFFSNTCGKAFSFLHNFFTNFSHIRQWVRMHHRGIEFVQRLHTSLRYNLLMMLCTNKAFHMFQAMYRCDHQLLNPQAMICKCTCEHFYERTTFSILLDKDRTLFWRLVNKIT